MEQVLQYFKHAERILDANEFEDDEQHHLFIQNVFSEIDGLEYRLACSHDGSVILEKVLTGATLYQLRVFFEKVRDRFLDMCCHRYASHVVERWIRLASASWSSDASANNDTSETIEKANNIPPTLLEQLGDISTWFTESLIRLAEDEYGTHVLRLFIRLAVGIESTNEPPFPGASKFIIQLGEQLFTLPHEIFSWDRASCTTHLSPALQTLLPLLTRIMQRRIYDSLFPPPMTLPQKSQTKPTTSPSKTLLRISEDPNGSHFLESLIKTFNDKDWLQFWEDAVQPVISKLLFGRHSNFVIQNLITFCHTKDQLTMFIDSIKPLASQLITENKYGVLIRLAKWSQEHQYSAIQEIIEIINAAFHFDSNENKTDLVMAMLILRPLNDLDDKAQIQNGGCQLLQILWSFPVNSIQDLVNSFQVYPVEKLFRLARHPAGSRVLEAFLTSTTIVDTIKKKIIRRLIDEKSTTKLAYADSINVDDLAVDKYGSHVVDHCFQVASPSLQGQLAEKLSKHLTKLQDSQYGRLVIRNCRLDDYLRDPTFWKNSHQKVERKRAMFSDILNEDKSSPKIEKVKKKKGS